MTDLSALLRGDVQKDDVATPVAQPSSNLSAILRGDAAVPAPAAPPTPPSPEWSDLPGNILPSAVQTGKSLIYPFLHPIEAAKGVYNIATDKDTRHAVAQFYKDRYGGLQNIHDTMIKDPVGALADISTVLGLGEFAAGKALGQTSRVAGALGTMSDVTNPISLAVKGAGAIAQPAAEAIEPIISHALGASTLAGPTAIRTAYKAGKQGSKTFLENLSGGVDREKVLDDVENGLNKIKTAAQADYKAQFPEADALIDPAPIHTAYNDFVDSLKSPNGKWKIGDDEVAKIEGVKKAIDEFTGGNAAPQDILELDALRQKINRMYPDGYKYNQLQRGIAQISDTIRNTINQVHPEYGPVLGRYSDAMDMLQDMRKTLSQTKTAGVDTKMRKLTKAMDATPEGARKVSMLKDIEDATGKPVTQALAGQALSGWLPGSMAPQALVAKGLGLGAAGYGAAHFAPLALAAAPFASPRLVGYGLYGAGAARRLAGSVPTLGPRGALAALQSGRALQAAGMPSDEFEAPEPDGNNMLSYR